jgi:hypothetical protein
MPIARFNHLQIENRAQFEFANIRVMALGDVR